MDLHVLTPIMKDLEQIFELGDRDECSWKHLGHGIASILAFGTWERLIDYTVPNDDGSFDEDETLLQELKQLWLGVELEIETLGVQEFVDRSSHFANYFKFMYVDTIYRTSWLPYREAIEAKGIKIGKE